MLLMSDYQNPGRLCMGCMRPLPEGRSECGFCGYPADGRNGPAFLPTDSLLSGRYLAGRLLDQTGADAVYMGYDTVLKSPIQIREFFPGTLCERAPDGSLRVMAGCEGPFREYYEKFRAHARALARLRELGSLLPVYDIFEENGTAYTVAESVEGVTLESRLKALGGRMRWEDARPLFMPLLSTLVSMHSAGMFHLGICPENLLIAPDGKLYLLGFCLADARRAGTDLQPSLPAGYAAPEQYGAGQDTGAWSDVYALAATIFRTLTGSPPPEASRRRSDSNDLFVPTEVAAALPDYVAAALFNALQVSAAQRTASAADFRDQLSTAPAVSRMIEDDAAAREAETSAAGPVGPSHRGRNIALLITGIFVALLLLGVLFVYLLFPEFFGRNGDVSEPASAVSEIVEETTAAPATTAPQGNLVEVPKLTGQNYYDIQGDDQPGGLVVKVGSLQYSGKERGVILSQDPAPGSALPEKGTITIVISAGSDTLTVPDVAGWSADNAEAYLKALGLRVERLPIASETTDYGYVESIEEAGKQVKLGEKVTLRVSETHLTTAQDDEGNDWFNNY